MVAATENKKGYGRGSYYVFDDHSHWEKGGDRELSDAWAKYFEDACKVVSIEDPSNKRGLLPAFAERILKERSKHQTNWREILDNFVQDEIDDYSFNPPDRRFSDSIFMLPDFNEASETVKNVLFMVDTSGSMSDDMISQAYQEIRGAIEQFGGKLEGYLGFFDAVIVKPVAFSTVDELNIIRPFGGGGTRFDIIFDYVETEMKDNPPSNIVILTDGYARFPNEDAANGIPVLWIINNDEVVPPWGKHTVITV
jgi:predicted metal-dependent peptidase